MVSPSLSLFYIQNQKHNFEESSGESVTELLFQKTQRTSCSFYFRTQLLFSQSKSFVQIPNAFFVQLAIRK